MKVNKNAANPETIEYYRIALVNVQENEKIAQAMAEFGYTSEVLEKGRRLLADARVLFDSCVKYKGIIKEAYDTFGEKLEELNVLYDVHRSKARVIFRGEKTILHKLAIHKPQPKTYVRSVEVIRVFYKTLKENPELMDKLSKFNFKAEEIDEALNMLVSVDAAKARYSDLKGDSQDATEKKAAKFEEIYLWMRDFYSMAKVALRESPQLLESLGEVVKN